jgi:hypothetical protein
MYWVDKFSNNIKKFNFCFLLIFFKKIKLIKIKPTKRIGYHQGV